MIKGRREDDELGPLSKVSQKSISQSSSTTLRVAAQSLRPATLSNNIVHARKKEVAAIETRTRRQVVN